MIRLGQRAEVRGQRAEVGGQRAEIRGQRAEVGNQRSGDRRPELGGRKNGKREDRGWAGLTKAQEKQEYFPWFSCVFYVLAFFIDKKLCLLGWGSVIAMIR